MENLKIDKQSLKKFGITMAIAFLAITTLIFIKHKHSILPTAIISLVFFVFAFILPLALKPIYIFWMKVAFALGWINTRLILCGLFYLVFTPIGITMRLLRIDLLDRKIEKDKQSYWKSKEKKEFKPVDYERQF